MLKSVKWVMGLGLLLTYSVAWAANGSLDSGSSSIKFFLSGVGGTTGKFAKFSGAAENYDPAQLQRLKVNIQIDGHSLDAGSKTGIYKSESIFHIEKYPQLSFVSTQVIPQGVNIAKMKGNLTMKGTTKPVEWVMRIDPNRSNQQYVYFKANTNIQRSQWKVDGYSALASDQVELIIQGRFKVTSS